MSRDHPQDATITDMRSVRSEDAPAAQLRTMQTAALAARVEALLDERDEIRLRYPWSERKESHAAHYDHVPLPVKEHRLSGDDAARLEEIEAEKGRLEEALTQRLTGAYVDDEGRRCFARMEH